MQAASATDTASMKSCAISITRRRSKLSAMAPEASEKIMTGSAIDACTSATMSAEAAIEVISHAAPTAWMSATEVGGEACRPNVPEYGISHGRQG